MAQLTAIVSNMAEFQFVTSYSSEEIVKAKEPLCMFVAAVGKSFESCIDFNTKCSISDKFNSYLNTFEKWWSGDIKTEKAEVTFRFYSFIAIVIYNCASIVYTKVTIYFNPNCK